MKYELTYNVEWDNDAGSYFINLHPYDVNAVKIFDDSGARIGSPDKDGFFLQDKNAVMEAFEYAEVTEEYCVDEYDEFWIGPVFVKAQDIGETHTIEFTSEDIKKLKEDGGVDFRESKLRLESGIRCMMDATKGDAGRVRTLFQDILNQVMTEEVMGV